MRTVYRLVTALVVLTVGSGGFSASAREEAAPKPVAITFDDLPFVSASPKTRAEAVRVNAAIRGVLVRNHVPATGFVTEKNVQALQADGPRLVRAWLGDGFELGNHGATHADTNDLQVGAVREEVVAGEATIAPLAKAFGRPVRFYRFAYNHAGNTPAKRRALESMLTEQGYHLAASTIDTSDYLFDRAYTHSADDRALQQRIEQAYLSHSREQIRYYAELNKQVLGREPPQVMLLHANSLNASTLDRLLAIFREEGYSFVSLEQAQADEAYRNPPAVATRHGPMWGYRWARERRVGDIGLREKEPPAWIQTLAESGKKPDS